MKEEVGNSLASVGISLILAYGLYVSAIYSDDHTPTDSSLAPRLVRWQTSFQVVYAFHESGLHISWSNTANPGMDWGYFSITPWIQSVVRDAGDGKFEIVVLVRKQPSLILLRLQLTLHSPRRIALCQSSTQK